jgi:hypothetical protein
MVGEGAQVLRVVVQDLVVLQVVLALFVSYGLETPVTFHQLAQGIYK